MRYFLDIELFPFKNEVQVLSALTLSNFFPQRFSQKQARSRCLEILLFHSSTVKLYVPVHRQLDVFLRSAQSFRFSQTRLLPAPSLQGTIPTCSIFSKHGINWVYRNSFFYKISIKKITSFYLQSVCYYKVIFPIGSNIRFANASVPIRKVKLCICIFLYLFVNV